MIDWIKFSERKPEEGEEIVIRLVNGNVSGVYVFDGIVMVNWEYWQSDHPPKEKKMKKVAMALIYFYEEKNPRLTQELFESISDVEKVYHSIRKFIWPATLPDKDGYFLVPEEE